MITAAVTAWNSKGELFSLFEKQFSKPVIAHAVEVYSGRIMMRRDGERRDVGPQRPFLITIQPVSRQSTMHVKIDDVGERSAGLSDSLTLRVLLSLLSI